MSATALPISTPLPLAQPHQAPWHSRLYRLGWLWLLLAAALAWFDSAGRWTDPGREGETVVLVKLWIFWSQWALLPWWMAATLALRGGQNWAQRLGQWLRWGVLTLAAYGCLVEPHLLVVREHRLHVPAPTGKPPLRVALLSDVHAGLFVRHWQVQRLVDRLNTLDVDAVVVAGDWVYHPPQDLDAVLAPFAQVRHPVWGVLGNHDTEAPGPPLAQALREALAAQGVKVLDGRRMAFQGWDVVGLSDLWGGNPRADIARLLPPGTPAKPRLVVAHQPDTAALLPAGASSLVLSGHTHGGQIKLPWITRHLALPQASARGWYKGFYATAAGALFVTSGTGTIGLPMRLGVRPRIDVLTLQP